MHRLSAIRLTGRFLGPVEPLLRRSIYVFYAVSCSLFYVYGTCGGYSHSPHWPLPWPSGTSIAAVFYCALLCSWLLSVSPVRHMRRSLATYSPHWPLLGPVQTYYYLPTYVRYCATGAALYHRAAHFPADRLHSFCFISSLPWKYPPHSALFSGHLPTDISTSSIQ